MTSSSWSWWWWWIHHCGNSSNHHATPKQSGWASGPLVAGALLHTYRLAKEIISQHVAINPSFSLRDDRASAPRIFFSTADDFTTRCGPHQTDCLPRPASTLTSSSSVSSPSPSFTASTAPVTCPSASSAPIHYHHTSLPTNAYYCGASAGPGSSSTSFSPSKGGLVCSSSPVTGCCHSKFEGSSYAAAICRRRSSFGQNTIPTSAICASTASYPSSLPAAKSSAGILHVGAQPPLERQNSSAFASETPDSSCPPSPVRECSSPYPPPTDYADYESKLLVPKEDRYSKAFESNAKQESCSTEQSEASVHKEKDVPDLQLQQPSDKSALLHASNPPLPDVPEIQQASCPKTDQPQLHSATSTKSNGEGAPDSDVQPLKSQRNEAEDEQPLTPKNPEHVDSLSPSGGAGFSPESAAPPSSDAAENGTAPSVEDGIVQRSGAQVRAVAHIWKNCVHKRMSLFFEAAELQLLLGQVATSVDLRKDPILCSNNDDSCVLWNGEVDSEGNPIMRVHGYYAWVTRFLTYCFADDESLLDVTRLWHVQRSTEATSMACGNRHCVRLDHISRKRQ